MINKLIILLGDYGSGKTELAINFSLMYSNQGKKTVLIDLDVVNTYFRSSDKTEILKKQNVDVISPDYANTNIDMPIVPKEVNVIFDSYIYDIAVIDVGGNTAGSKAIGQYHDKIVALKENVEIYYVVNVFRPMSNLKNISHMYDNIKKTSRLNPTAFINNSNLLGDTCLKDVLNSQVLMEEISKEKNIPVKYLFAKKSIIDNLNFDEKFKPTLLEINPIMRPEWLK